MPRIKTGANNIYDIYGGRPGMPPSSQQLRFHESPAIYRLYGGAKGGGKSVALLWEAILHCLRVPGSNALLLRRTFPELKKGLIRHFELLVPSAIYGGPRSYNQSDHTVTFRNGSKLFFGSVQHEKDVYNYQGQEFVFIGIDEATEFSYTMFEFLTLQNRCPVKTDSHGSPVIPCMALATNPGGIGHVWVKALFIGQLIDGKYVRTVENVTKTIRELENANINLDNYEFIPAKIFDNPAYANDEVYLNKLRSANQAWKARYLLGSWEEVEGAYFENFDRALTVMDRFRALRLVRTQPWQPKWIAIDWGYQHWAAVYWFSTVTVSDEEGVGWDRTLIYREMVLQKTGEADLATAIAEKCKYEGTKVENISAIYLSPDCWAKRSSENTIAEKLGDIFQRNRLPPPSPADDDRVGGARLMDEMLSRRPDADLLISDDCEELIDAIPVLQRNPKAEHNEDVLKTEEKSDDIYDACRYGLKSQLGSGKTPFDVQRERILKELPNDNARLFADIAMQNKRKSVGVRFSRPRFPGSF